MTLTQDNIDAFEHIVQDTRVAHRDLLGALDRIEAAEWPQRDEVLGDVFALIEPTLWKLSVRLTRISSRAADALPPLHKVRLDELDDELAASADRSDQPSNNEDTD